MTEAKSGLDAGLYRDEAEEYVVTDDLGSDRDICFKSLAGATPSIEIVVSGNDTPLSVDVVGSAVTVNSATNGSGDAASTAAEIKAAVNADVSAKLLWEARLPPGQDGSGVTGAMSSKTAASGVAFAALSLTDSGDHLRYQAASGSRYWDPDETLVVYIDGSPATSGYTVNYLRGRITFEESQSGHTITATGTRRSELAFQKIAGLFDCKPKFGEKDADTTSCDDGGWTSSIVMARTWEFSAGTFFYPGSIPIDDIGAAYIWKLWSVRDTTVLGVGKGTIQGLENVLASTTEAQKQTITVKGQGEFYLER
jgi:hypothetical protein